MCSSNYSNRYNWCYNMTSDDITTGYYCKDMTIRDTRKIDIYDNKRQQ